MDVQLIRRQFTSLNHDWVLFENAGGTQVPDQVIQRVANFYRESNVQPGDFYPKAVQSEETVREAHRFIADLLGAPSPQQIIFGPSATALNRLIAVSLQRRWQEGDEIIVTISDHEANVTPWVFLENFGLKVKFWPINRDSFDLETEQLKNLLTDRTVLVAFPHISNILGTENPVAEIIRMVHDAGALVYVDGVASTPHRAIDVAKWNADFFVFSTYKTFGPHSAAIYVQEDILDQLTSVNHFFIGNESPRKFELGTPNLEGCAAILGIRDYFKIISGTTGDSFPRKKIVALMNNIHEYEIDLAWKLIDGLTRFRSVKIIGLSDRTQRERRVPVVAFTADPVAPDQIVKKLVDQKIALGSGHFYAYRLIHYLGLLEKGGVVRASLVHYNTEEEIRRFLTQLERILDKK